jgi:hypothetical protein
MSVGEEADAAIRLFCCGEGCAFGVGTTIKVDWACAVANRSVDAKVKRKTILKCLGGMVPPNSVASIAPPTSADLENDC